MDWEFFVRYALEFGVLYPGAVLSYLPVQGYLRFSRRRTFAVVFAGVTALVLGGALVCTFFRCSSNALLVPIHCLSFLAYRYTLSRDFVLGKAVYTYTTMSALMGACTVLTCVVMAEKEVENPHDVFLPSSTLLCLGFSVLVILLYIPLMRPMVAWLMSEFHAQRVWLFMWILPAGFTVIYCLMQPRYPATVLINRVQPMGIVLVIASLVVLYILTLLYYHIAREIMANARLAKENQLLAIEAHRYQELRSHMEETHLMRHDFRQHLRVISNLADAGRLDELKQYMSQYDQKLDGERLSLCANAAVDAIAGYYHHYALTYSIPIEWKLSLPEALPLPETDICMLLGNLVENALQASANLPAEQRSVRVICQMLSPVMLGLIVENAYNGVVKKQGDTFLSTRHNGPGFGLQSVENTVSRYHGRLSIETDNQVFSVNVLLNL